MKKFVFLSIFMLMASVSYSATDFSSSTNLVSADTETPDAAQGVTIMQCSNNVNGTVVSSSTQFAALTKHLNGTRNYATASTDTKIYWTDVEAANKGTATFEITLANSDTSDFSDWTAL